MIRSAATSDHPWIRSVAADVYRDLGDYRTIIGSWLDHPGILVFPDEVGHGADARRRGFILVGFYAPPAAPDTCVADLLAIAVTPEEQRKGVGRRLLEHAVHLAENAARSRDVREMRLTVADSNVGGQRLFRSLGFTILDEEHGHYDGGQRAIRMARPVREVAPQAP